jgi:hypothetical protein
MRDTRATRVRCENAKHTTRAELYASRQKVRSAEFMECVHVSCTSIAQSHRRGFEARARCATRTVNLQKSSEIQ